MGSSGYCFVTDGTAVSLLNTQSFSLYYLDPAATSAPALQYAIAPAAKLVSDWVVQANSLGSLGYNYKGAFSVGGVAGDMFVKYATTTDVFIYRGVGISVGDPGEEVGEGPRTLPSCRPVSSSSGSSSSSSGCSPGA